MISHASAALSLRPHFGGEASILRAWDGGLDLPQTLSLLLPSGLVFSHQLSQQNPHKCWSGPRLCFFSPRGIERFRGQYFHSRQYKHPDVFQGKRVLVVGMGNSGVDIAVEASRVAAKVPPPCHPRGVGRGTLGTAAQRTVITGTWCTKSLSEPEFFFGQKAISKASWVWSCLLFLLHHQQPGGLKDAVAAFPLPGHLRPSESLYKGKAANSSPEPLILLFQVTISTSRGAWLLSRVFEHGYPWDMVLNTRLMSLIKTNLPAPLSWWLLNYKANQWFNHENYGIQPEKRYFLVVPIP